MILEYTKNNFVDIDSIVAIQQDHDFTNIYISNSDILSVRQEHGDIIIKTFMEERLIPQKKLPKLKRK